MSSFFQLRLVSQTFILAIATCISGVAYATDQAALDLLTRMQAASQNINYYGTLIFLQDGQVQSMRVVHKADKNGQFERVINLNGIAREVVRRDNVVVCYMPDSKEVMVSHQEFNGNALAKLAGNDFAELQKNYQFTSEAVERVAGRDAQRILIQPKDELRYGYRLWVDANNAILLKSDLLNEKGESLEQAMFADIAVVDRIPEALLKPTSTGDGYTWYEREPENNSDQAQITTSRWSIESLPSGFMLSARFRQQMPGSSVPSEHWVLSDGLASISVYFEKLAEDQGAFEGASSMGAVNVFGAINAGYQITVIGEVPEGTVEKVARSATFTSSEEND